MGTKASERKIVMAKLVAARWLEARTHSEYRLKVYYGPREIKNLPGLLRSFRDAKLRIGSVEPIQDLGLREEFDHIEMWSSDRAKLAQLCAWFEERGLETSGVW